MTRRPRILAPVQWVTIALTLATCGRAILTSWAPPDQLVALLVAMWGVLGGAYATSRFTWRDRS